MDLSRLGALPKPELPGLMVVGIIEPGPAVNQLQWGDVIHTVAGKPVPDESSMIAALQSLTVRKQVEVSFSRISERTWKRNVVSLKLEKASATVEAAMKPKKDASNVLHYSYISLPEQFSVPLLSLRVLEDEGRFFPELQFSYAANRSLFVKKLVFSSSNGTFELDVLKEYVARETDATGVKERVTLNLQTDQLDAFRNVMDRSSVNVRLIGNRETVDHELSVSEWVGIRTASIFYRLKTGGDL